MKHMAGQGFTAGGVALALALSLIGIAAAQQNPGPPPADQAPGLVEGDVVRCVNGAPQPAIAAAVGVEGGAMSGRTDNDGHFFLSLPPGNWTVVAATGDGSASRYYVPVDSGVLLDIGTLEIGGGMSGCAPDVEVAAPALPTFTPTAIPEPPTPTPLPPLPTATPIPAPPAEESVPEMSPASGG
jgi:hypothetical protein